MNKYNVDKKEEKRKRNKKAGLYIIGGVVAAGVIATAIAVPLSLNSKNNKTNEFVEYSESGVEGANSATNGLTEKTFGKEAARKIVEGSDKIKETVQKVIEEQMVEQKQIDPTFIEPPKTTKGDPVIDSDNVDMTVTDVSVKMFVPLPETPDKERFDIKYMVDVQHKDADTAAGTLHVTTDQDHNVHEVMFVPRPESAVPPVTITQKANPTAMATINTDVEEAVESLHHRKWNQDIGEKVLEMVQKITGSDFDADLDISEQMRSNYISQIIGLTKDQKQYDDGAGGKTLSNVDKEIQTQAEYENIQKQLAALDKEMQDKIDLLEEKVVAHDFRATIDFGGGDVRTVVDNDMQYREYLRDYYLKHLKLGAVSMETTNALMLLKAMMSFPEFDYAEQTLGAIDLPQAIGDTTAGGAGKGNYDARQKDLDAQIEADVLGWERNHQDEKYAKDPSYEKRYILPVNGEILTFATEQEADDYYNEKFGPDSYSLEILGTGEILSIPSNIENLDPRTIVTQLSKPIYERRKADGTTAAPVPDTYKAIYENGWDKDTSKADFSRIRDTLVAYMKDRYELLTGSTSLSSNDGATQADVDAMKDAIGDELTDDELKSGMLGQKPTSSMYETLIVKEITPLFMKAMEVFKEQKAVIKVVLANGPKGNPIFLRDSEGEIVKLASSSDLPIAKVIKGADSSLVGEKNITHIYVKKHDKAYYLAEYKKQHATQLPLLEQLTNYLDKGIIPLEYTQPDKDYTIQYSEEGKMLLFPLTEFGVLKYPVEFKDQAKYDPKAMPFFNADGSDHLDAATPDGVGAEKMFEQLDNFIFEESFTSWMGEIDGKITTLLETPDPTSSQLPLDVLYKNPSEHKFTIDYMDNPYEFHGKFYATKEEADKAKADALK